MKLYKYVQYRSSRADIIFVSTIAVITYTNNK